MNMNSIKQTRIMCMVSFMEAGNVTTAVQLTTIPRLISIRGTARFVNMTCVIPVPEMVTNVSLKLHVTDVILHNLCR